MALDWGRRSFLWYNQEHRHGGIAFLTPADVYFGHAEAVLEHGHARKSVIIRSGGGFVLAAQCTH